jgi:hypothetical protein
MGFTHFSGVERNHTEASGLTTKLTTLGDIHRSSAYGRLLSLLQGKQTNKSQVIYTALVPRNSGAFFNSSTAALAKWVTMFVGQSWTNTLVSLFGLHLQSSERWTCWPASVTGPAARSFGKQLSSTSRHDSDPPIHKMCPEVDEYLFSGLETPCW